ncbi:uncharacterized protein LOC123222619 [Mangifera indica]|uniref:uncharacterized protein LOC123222619 n=1 Tax=Mangifera indica TaxID=29780 RepID=UPI001CFA5F52|nr:uncharacterized protein LOC123222619 [Mangifera indica]
MAVLIAYENGLMIYWDVSEPKISFVGGDKVLQLKNGVVDYPSELDSNLSDSILEHHQQEKEINFLCWASSNGFILAIGYIDGDILFWNTSNFGPTKGQQIGSSNDVVKLELTFVKKRLPIIVFHWSVDNESCNNSNGRLFVYGGAEIGSEEVLTVLSLEWSSRMDALRCVGRIDLTLRGTFVDMILLPAFGAKGGHHKADLYVLTSPGQLHLYDGAGLSASLSQQETKPSVFAVEYPGVIPTVDPVMTAANFSAFSMGGNSSKASLMKLSSSPILAGEIKWPFIGGLPSQLFVTRDHIVNKVYVAGYQDGIVRIWDATDTVLKPIFVLKGEVQGIEVACSSAPVSTLNFSFLNSTLVVGNECSLVRIYNLNSSTGDTNIHFVSETKHEVHMLPEGKGTHCKAVFSLVNSPVRAQQFANSGAKLAVGFECGRVAVIDINFLSVMFVTDSTSGYSSPVVSMIWSEYGNKHSFVKSPNHLETKITVNLEDEVIFILLKDAKLCIIDVATGNMIGSRPLNLKKEATRKPQYLALPLKSSLCSLSRITTPKTDRMPDATSVETNSPETEHLSSLEFECSGERLSDALGNKKSIHKVKHAKPCCWTTTFSKDGKLCGLVSLFQSGVVEIRSLFDLKLVKETSLMSILGWSFKANMDKKINANNGQITLVNGSEVAFIHQLDAENDEQNSKDYHCSRFLESLSCLHDKVLEAAADAAITVCSNQKKKQGNASGILGGIVKGFKVRKDSHAVAPKSSFTHLGGIFLKPPFPDSSPTVTEDEKVAELNIDDIEIDETHSVVATSSHEVAHMKKDKGTTRERLLGEPDDTKPRVRIYEKIITKYRTNEVVSDYRFGFTRNSSFK